MKVISYFLLPLFYLLVGGFVTAMLVHRLVTYADTSWPMLLIPMLMFTTLLTVIGVCNVWVHYRTWHDEGLMHSYTHRRLLWLYARAWFTVFSGLSIGVIYYWMQDLLAETVQNLLADLSLLFYLFLSFLTGGALLSIIRGENLSEIRLRNSQHENQLLKSQLNPHFLYNTLNNIDALIWIDQERASSAVTSLSALMRYLTYSSRQEYVTLQAEIEHIEQLVELQRLRMSQANSLLFVNKVSASKAAHIHIAPLLLMPLVENAFKHCSSLDEDQAIIFSLRIVDGILRFETDNVVSDSDSMLANGEKRLKSTTLHGVGLTVLRRRLELLYPKAFSLSTQRDGSRFRAILTISFE